MTTVTHARHEASAPLWLERLADKLPEITLVATDGGRRQFSDWRGKLVLLHFWATWCDPCRHELPSLAKLAAQLDPARFEVLIIAIDDDKSGQELAAYVQALDVKLPVYVAKESQMPTAFWSWGVPVTYIVDGSTREASRALGPRDWNQLGPTFNTLMPVR